MANEDSVLYVLTITTYNPEKYVLRNEEDGTEWRGQRTTDTSSSGQPRATWLRNQNQQKSTTGE